jgi:hypothetical protein
MGVLGELRRRKVFRVAVVYAATTFVVLQAEDIMLKTLLEMRTLNARAAREAP